MKNILKIVIFGAGLILIMCVMNILLDGGRLASEGKVVYYDRRIAGLNAEPEGEIEVLFVGDSLCGACFNSPSLYRDYGITSYNMGKEMQKSVETYYCIKRAIEKQPIKVVVWEAHNLTKCYEDTEPLSYGLAESIRYRFPFIKYHIFWRFYFNGCSIRKYIKGFLVSEVVTPYETEVPYYDPDDVDENYKLQYDQEYMLTKIQKLCEENGIKLVLFSSVSPKCYQNYLHVAFEKEAGKHGLDYLDANYDVEQLGIDWSNDFTDDGDHVNVFGAEKITDYVGKYLVSECGLADHRGDPAYRSWDEMTKMYAQEVIDMEGTDYFEKEKEAGIERQILYLTPRVKK